MYELLLALALVLVIEGVLYALFPEGMKRAMITVLEQPATVIRPVGLGVALFGLFLVWLIKG
jgi:uncharacterized protein YjeT (DUF2065 family)